ncbi:MAG TPA: hypothetical protein VIT88_15250 [Pyrinomonadaceae bacterium]
MTGNTAVSFHRGVFVNKRSLLIGVTLYASRIRARCQPRLFQLKPTMRVMAIAAFHGSFKNFVMEGEVKLVLGFAMATDAELRLVHLQKF